MDWQRINEARPHREWRQQDWLATLLAKWTALVATTHARQTVAEALAAVRLREFAFDIYSAGVARCYASQFRNLPT